MTTVSNWDATTFFERLTDTNILARNEGTEKRCIFIKIHKTNWIAMIFCCNPFFVVIGDL